MRNRSAEQITLGKINPCGLQRLELLAALNSLGHRHDVEAARQCQHGINDRRAVPAACDPLRERLIDFDLVERKARQVACRRVSGPAIVENHRDSEIFQLPYGVQIRRLAFLQKREVRDFKFQPLRREAGIQQHSQYEIEKVSLAELNGGDVDGNPDMRRPGGGIHARLLQDPSSERQHQPARFRKRQELLRREKASRRMMPAHKRLHAAYATRPGIDYRLIMQFEFVLRYRLAQLVFHRLLCVCSLGQFGLEYAEIISSVGLRRIERKIRPFQESLGIVAMLRGKGNSDAGPDADPVAVEIEWLVDK